MAGKDLLFTEVKVHRFQLYKIVFLSQHEGKQAYKLKLIIHAISAFLTTAILFGTF